jgi:DNA adenine methylase
MDGIEIDHLYQVAARFKRVQIECRDALEVIELYDNPEALIYFDPPYVASTRVNGKYYDYEVDDSFHRQAAELLRAAKGYVMVSGYASPLYAEIYEAYGWTRCDSTSVATNGGKRVESVWLSPRTLQAPGQFQLSFY